MAMAVVVGEAVGTPVVGSSVGDALGAVGPALGPTLGPAVGRVVVGEGVVGEDVGERVIGARVGPAVSGCAHSHLFWVPGKGSPKTPLVQATLWRTGRLEDQLDPDPYRTYPPAHSHVPPSVAHSLQLPRGGVGAPVGADVGTKEQLSLILAQVPAVNMGGVEQRGQTWWVHMGLVAACRRVGE